ncbi:MAG: ATP-binding protein [Clostridia bacterium]|nr:ATP-binding protein [Clostridia bacterium]
MKSSDNETLIPKRVLSSLLTSVSAGVVPRKGAHYIAIGREKEIAALSADLDNAAEGGCSTRFIIGRYGSGKSFLMQLIRETALDRGFLVCDADLSPDRKLFGSSGAGAATYRELIRNMSSRTCPDGNALSRIISSFFAGIGSQAAESGLSPGTEEFNEHVRSRIYKVIRETEDSVGGFDFASVLSYYYKAHEDDDDEKKSAALRWLRGEYSTKTEARNAMGIPVSSIIFDDNWYDYIKLLASFARKIGFSGLLVLIDECVNLFKIPNRISREGNYEKILSIFNDTLGGRAPGLVFIFGGTPEFLEDTRRGLFSYEALRSRLSEGAFLGKNYTNLLTPLIRLRPLSDNELLALITRLSILHKQYYPDSASISGEQRIAFLEIELSRMGANVMITPREVIRDYLEILDILMQDETASFDQLLKSIAPAESKAGTEKNNVVEKKAGVDLTDFDL